MVSPCQHVVTGIYTCGIIAYDNDAMPTTRLVSHTIDPKLPTGLNLRLMDQEPGRVGNVVNARTRRASRSPSQGSSGRSVSPPSAPPSAPSSPAGQSSQAPSVGQQNIPPPWEPSFNARPSVQNTQSYVAPINIKNLK